MIVLGICGGTGSGKTTITGEIIEKFNKESITLLEQDSYYKDLKNLSFKERSTMNFDHPDAVDFTLMIKHIKQLKAGNSIQKPFYDFTLHIRTSNIKCIRPTKILIVEGILIFSIPKLRNLFDMKIFVDTDDDERLLRRIIRDLKERNRSIENIQHQYLSTVKSMHHAFVEPSKRYADIIIPRGGGNKIAIEMLTSRLKVLINQNIGNE